MTSASDPVWRGEVELRWVVHPKYVRLFAGTIYLGWMYFSGAAHHRSAQWCSTSTDKISTWHKTEHEAREALVAAAVEALTGKKI
jgi:hypothetical protein